MLEKNEKRIQKIKQELQAIGDMRTGSLTQQFHKRGGKRWPYWQISYTYKMRSKTEYVRDEFVEQLAKEIAEYKKYKELTAEWLELSIELSKQRLERAKKLMEK